MTRSRLMLLGGLAALFVMWMLAVVGTSDEPGTGAVRWEYLVVSEVVGTYHNQEHVKLPGTPVYWMREDHNVQERMDVLGEEGWDLVSCTPCSEGEAGEYVFVFKRPLP
jgi:hypothetical protein